MRNRELVLREGSWHSFVRCSSSKPVVRNREHVGFLAGRHEATTDPELRRDYLRALIRELSQQIRKDGHVISKKLRDVEWMISVQEE